MARHLSPTLVWVALVAATLASFAAFELDSGSGAYAVPLILAVAAIKGRLILRHFMDLKVGPLAHRIYFDAWVIGCAALIAGIHWWSA
jgi:caa(3)-type oxidase subunit IV